ncbi:hypothetical protein Tco_1414632 [Tanacetum coccineum]
MAAVNDVPQLVDKKRGSYAAIAPKLEPGKFSKWKKQMLFYLAGMKPYYLKCIKDGPFQPKIVEGDAKPESQWTPDERRVVDFQENSDDEVDEKTSEEYLRDLDINSQNPKTFQPKNKGLVAETFDWDEEEVSNEEEVTQVKVLMALDDDELTVGKSHARNGEWVNITMRKVNTLLFMDEDADWKNYLKYIKIDLKFVEE